LVKPETKFWYELKRNTNKIIWTRLENKALHGTPDLLGYNTNSHFFTVELKVAKSNRVLFSPHQISFHVVHEKNSFILVSCSPDRGLVRLYPGSGILELVRLGLKLEPLVRGWGPVRLKLESL
tara:strand:+ start:128 stop:496 length:369 start_codon:yes stop_codon:yes gene_type:complete